MNTQTQQQMSGKLSAILETKFGGKYEVFTDEKAFNVISVMRNHKHVATYHIPSASMSVVHPNSHLIDFEDYSTLIYETEGEMND